MPKDIELVAVNTKHQKCGITNAIISSKALGNR